MASAPCLITVVSATLYAGSGLQRRKAFVTLLFIGKVDTAGPKITVNVEIDAFLSGDIRYFAYLYAVLLAHSAQEPEAKPVTQSHIAYVCWEDNSSVVVIEDDSKVLNGDALSHFFHWPDHDNRIENE